MPIRKLIKQVTAAGLEILIQIYNKAEGQWLMDMATNGHWD